MDPNNVPVDTYNLTINNIGLAENYETLKNKLIHVAANAPVPADDHLATPPDTMVDVRVLNNDQLSAGLMIDSVTSPSEGTAEVITVERPVDLKPIASVMPDLVISEVAPGEFIELFNARFATADLAQAEQLLVWATSQVAIADLADGLAPLEPRSYVRLDWPAAFPADKLAGEVAVYHDAGSGIDDVTKIQDFVAWGDPVANSRHDVAVAAGRWSGARIAEIAGASLQRLPASPGTFAASYQAGEAATPGSAYQNAVEVQQVVRYQAPADHSGDVSFSYVVRNDLGYSNRAEITITLDADASAWQNPTSRLDVNNDGDVTPVDALAIINALNAGFRGPISLPAQQFFAPPGFVDSNGNRSVDSLDALLVINHLNGTAAEGEAAAAAADPADAALVQYAEQREAGGMDPSPQLPLLLDFPDATGHDAGIEIGFAEDDADERRSWTAPAAGSSEQLPLTEDAVDALFSLSE